MFARSSASPLGAVARNASRISSSSASEVVRRLIASTFASFQRRAPSAVAASCAERRADPRHLVRGDRGAGAGPAAHDGLLGAPLGDVAGGRLARPGPLLALLARSASAPCARTSWPRRSSASAQDTRQRRPPRRWRSRCASARVWQSRGLPARQPGALGDTREQPACRRSSPLSSLWKATARIAPSPRRDRRGRRRSQAPPRPRRARAIHGARMKIARIGPPSMPATSRSASKLLICRPKALRAARMSIDPEVIAVEHDEARRRSRARAGRREERAQRLPQAPRARCRASSWSTRRPGSTSPSSPSRSAGTRTSRTLAPRRAQRRARAPRSPPAARARRSAVRRQRSGALSARSAAHGAQRRATSRAGRAAARPRASSSRGSSWACRDHARPAATRSASCQCVVASTIARAREGGSSDLKIPEPTNTPSAPSAIISAASAGVAMPPAQKSTTGRRPSLGDVAHELERRAAAPWRR